MLGPKQWEWIATARMVSRQRQSTGAIEDVLDGLLSGADQAMVNAFTSGFRWGFWVAAGIWTAGLLASVIFIRREEVAHPEAVELPAPQS